MDEYCLCQLSGWRKQDIWKPLCNKITSRYLPSSEHQFPADLLVLYFWKPVLMPTHNHMHCQVQLFGHLKWALSNNDWASNTAWKNLADFFLMQKKHQQKNDKRNKLFLMINHVPLIFSSSSVKMLIMWVASLISSRQRRRKRPRRCLAPTNEQSVWSWLTKQNMLPWWISCSFVRLQWSSQSSSSLW